MTKDDLQEQGEGLVTYSHFYKLLEKIRPFLMTPTQWYSLTLGSARFSSDMGLIKTRMKHCDSADFPKLDSETFQN